MLAAIDLVFALDSIPAVMGISRDKTGYLYIQYFCCAGLAFFFFLLRGAVSKFDYLQQGIAIVLVFIGLKMLAEHWINQWVDKQHTGVYFTWVLLWSVYRVLFSIPFLWKKKGCLRM